MNRWTSVPLAVGGLIAFPLVDSAIKGTLILVLAAAVCLWLRRDSAATRHFVWTIAIGLLVAMPVLSLVLPQWRILPGWMNSEPVTLQQISLPTLPSEATLVGADVIDEPAQPIEFEDLPADRSDLESDVLTVPVPLTDNSPADAVSAIDPVQETATTLPAWISVTWLIGCALLLVRLSIAAVMLRRSERRCVVIQRSHHAPRDERGSESRESNIHPLASGMRQLPGPESSHSISVAKATEYRPVDTGRSPEELGIALEQSKLALGLKRPVVLLLDPKRSIPIVWGLWKTRLQLPKEALQWSDEQLQSVLLHELAHVRRRDLFVLALTQIASALHWFNPLVWIAAWRLHVERERACDDLVLNTGIRASSYAEHLLNVATRLTSSRWTQACGLAMARNSSLHGRLSAVLSEKQNRRSVTTALAIGLVLSAMAIAAPMAMLRGSDDTQNEDAKTDVTGDGDEQTPKANSTGAELFDQIGNKPMAFSGVFNELRWGKTHECGLRTAIVTNHEDDSVPMGTVTKRKLILHNCESQPISIQLLSVVHYHQSPNAVGSLRLPFFRSIWRPRGWAEVPADSCIAFDTSEISFGDDFAEKRPSELKVVQCISASVRDTITTSAEVLLVIEDRPGNARQREPISLKSGEVKFDLLPWIPDAPRMVRTADTAGNYIVADNLRLLVKRIAEGSDQYTARLVCSKPTAWESEPISITSPFKFAWTRHSGEVWLAERSGIKKLSYNATNADVILKDEVLPSVPERFRFQIAAVSSTASIEGEDSKARAMSDVPKGPEAGDEDTLHGDTIVAKVNGKPITVDDVLGGGRQIIEADSRLAEKEREAVLRMAVQKRLQKFVDAELVMQEMERAVPKKKRDAIREELEPRFLEFLENIRKDHEFETDDELSAKLASEGNTISSLRELFLRSQMIDGYLSSLTKVPEKFTPEELLEHYEQHQSDYVIWESESADSKATQVIQPFHKIEMKIEQHLRRKLREEGRAKALEEIRSRSTVEVFVELKRDQDAEPKANANLVKHPDAHAVLQEGKPERTSEEQAIVASLLASETERALISLENSKVDLEAKRSANKEHAEAYSADELKLAELEVAEKEAVLWHAVALLKEANLQKNAGGPTGDTKSLAEAKAAVRLAETNIARRRLATLELTQQLNQAANQKTPGTYTSEEMEKLAVEIEKAKARIAELTGGPREKPQAAKAPGSQVEQQGDLRIATHPGLFEIGDRVFLWVARKLHPDPDENGASLVRVSKEGKQIATDIPLPSGEGTWAAGWVRGGKVLWVAQKGKVTRYDFSDSEQVQTTDETQSSIGEAIPKELNNLLLQAIREGGAAADGKEPLQDRGEDHAASDEPRASLDQPESSSRRIVAWEDLAINATTLAEIRDEEMALDEVSEDLKTLNGKRIVLRGYMYPTFEATGINEFSLVSDLLAAICAKKLLVDDVVAVQLHDKNVTDFVEGREISVDGILRIEPRLNRTGELYQLYQLEDAQILQLHARTSVRKIGIPVSSASAEKSIVDAPEYRAAFEHGVYDLGRGRALRIRAIDQQQQSLIIEWPSEKPSEVYSWTMFPEAPDRADFRMSPEKPWSQTTGWGVVWQTDSDTVWIADGSRRKTLNIAEPTAITIADAGYNVDIERAFREHIGMLARIPSRDEMRQFTLFLTPKVLEGALAKVKEQQEEGKRSTDVRVEAAKLKKISK